MIEITQFPRLLHGLSYGYLAAELLRRLRGRVRRARRNRAEFYADTWRQAAAQLDASVRNIFGDVYAIELNGIEARVMCNYTPLDDPVTLKVAGNKPVVQAMLGEAGLPIPRHTEFTLQSLSKAVSFLQETQGPCVVKPAGGTGSGKGITTGVEQATQLAIASAFANRFCRDLMIEQQAVGDNYRLLYLDGVLLDAVRRDFPCVVGDGRSTVRRLIATENQQRLQQGWHTSQVLLTRDADLKHTLSRQGLTQRSVPAAGERVILKTVINENAASENAAATDVMCDSIKQTGAQAARALGVRLAGVDIVTTDPSRSLAATGGVILEVNTTPGLYHHLRGDGCSVAVPILKAILEMQRTTCARSIAAAYT